MDTFPEDSQGSSTFESLTSHHKQQVFAESTFSFCFRQRWVLRQPLGGNGPSPNSFVFFMKDRRVRIAVLYLCCTLCDYYVHFGKEAGQNDRAKKTATIGGSHYCTLRALGTSPTRNPHKRDCGIDSRRRSTLSVL